MTDIDQDNVQCVICGKAFSFNRWSSGPRRCTCSEACQILLDEITGDRTSMKYMRQRAADPDICIICAGPLEKRDRSFKLYCGQRCQKIGWRRGVNTEELTAIRVNAVRTAHGHPMHAKEGKEGDP